MSGCSIWTRQQCCCFPLGRRVGHPWVLVAFAVKDEKTMITYCLAMSSAPGELCALLIYHAETSAVHPCGPYFNNLACTHSPNHWSNLDTMENCFCRWTSSCAALPTAKHLGCCCSIAAPFILVSHSALLLRKSTHMWCCATWKRGQAACAAIAFGRGA